MSCLPNKRCSNARPTKETHGNVTGANRRPTKRTQVRQSPRAVLLSHDRVRSMSQWPFFVKEAIPTEQNMIWFPSRGTDAQVTNCLESLTTTQHVSNESSVKVTMSADLVDHFEFTGCKTLLALSWSSKSRKIQVQGPGGMLDHARQQLSRLMEVDYDYCEMGQVKRPARGSERHC